MVSSIAQEKPIVGAAHFTTTHWSVVLQAGRDDSLAAREALEKLCRSYWYPIYAFVRRKGHSQEDAEDLTQEFFSQMLRRNDFASVSPEQGRFRSFLLASLKHFLANEWHRHHTQKRGSGQPVFSLDGTSPEDRYLHEPVSHAAPDTIYERRWALTVLEHVLERLRQEYVTAEKGDLFETLKVFLSEKKSTPHAAIASKYGISVGAVDVAIHRLRRRYADLMREEIAQTVCRTEDVEDEIRHLIASVG